MEEMLAVKKKQARLKVRAGMGRFDGHFGNGTWAHRIRRHELSLRATDQCIVTQVFGSLLLGLQALDLLDDPKSAADFGFAVGGTMSIEERDAEYAILTEVWKEEISERLKIASPPENERALEGFAREPETTEDERQPICA